jgi:hypothetical protein
VTGDPTKGGGLVFNANGKGLQLVADVRAGCVREPALLLSERLRLGSAEFNHRIQQLFGSIYNVTIGQTFSPLRTPTSGRTR